MGGSGGGALPTDAPSDVFRKEVTRLEELGRYEQGLTRLREDEAEERRVMECRQWERDEEYFRKHIEMNFQEVLNVVINMAYRERWSIMRYLLGKKAARESLLQGDAAATAGARAVRSGEAGSPRPTGGRVVVVRTEGTATYSSPRTGQLVHSASSPTVQKLAASPPSTLRTPSPPSALRSISPAATPGSPTTKTVHFATGQSPLQRGATISTITRTATNPASPQTISPNLRQAGEVFAKRVPSAPQTPSMYSSPQSPTKRLAV